MSVYQLLAKRNWPERRVFATIHALRGGVTASASFTDEEMAMLEEELSGIGTIILEKDFEAVRPIPRPYVCPDCDFLPLCTAPGNGNAGIIWRNSPLSERFTKSLPQSPGL